MSASLRKNFERFISLDDATFQEVLSYFKPIQLRKKQNLFTEGQLCRHQYFVVKGCLRMFFIKENGIEQTSQFAIESWWIADYMSLVKQQPAQFTLQAVEPAELLALDIHMQEKLLKRFPQMEKFFRHIYQNANAALQMRMKFLYDYSKEELYRHFRDSFPDFIQRVPQYLVASYLGITPEYLSEIRKKLIS